MKKGQNIRYKKEVFQTGLSERSLGRDALNNFLSNQNKRNRQNIARKKKRKK